MKSTRTIAVWATIIAGIVDLSLAGVPEATPLIIPCVMFVLIAGPFALLPRRLWPRIGFGWFAAGIGAAAYTMGLEFANCDRGSWLIVPLTSVILVPLEFAGMLVNARLAVAVCVVVTSASALFGYFRIKPRAWTIIPLTVVAAFVATIALTYGVAVAHGVVPAAHSCGLQF